MSRRTIRADRDGRPSRRCVRHSWTGGASRTGSQTSSVMSADVSKRARMPSPAPRPTITFTVRADMAWTTTSGSAMCRCSISHRTVPARMVTMGQVSRSRQWTWSRPASGWSVRTQTPTAADTSGIRRSPGAAGLTGVVTTPKSSVPSSTAASMAAEAPSWTVNRSPGCRSRSRPTTGAMIVSAVTETPPIRTRPW
ncbi:hypothetical protein LUW76_14195 [Actinomadura madurae]|nr:hypothetical protein [Actinomadura madurae]URM95374.1 hypothetical protein LUW76_14195 [Actinomadura madurae]